MSWDGCYNDGAMDLKKGNQFNYLLRVIPAVAYTLANILAIHPASYLTFDRAFYLNIHVILFEIYIYIPSASLSSFFLVVPKKPVFFQKNRFLILSKNHHHI